MPRKDLHVTLGGIEIKPTLALGAWAAFLMVGKNDAMVMGDLVLTEEEVARRSGKLLNETRYNEQSRETVRVMIGEVPGSVHKRQTQRATVVTPSPLILRRPRVFC